MSFGFVVWLWAFVFARIPLAAIQHYFGLESRPFLLTNLISIGLTCIAFNDIGWKPVSFLKRRRVVLTASALFAFWVLYFLRLGFDTFIEPVDFIESGFTLSKSFVNSTLISILCLPWILMMRRSSFSIDLCALLGSISVCIGAVAYLMMPMKDGIYYSRFGFEDLNPIPAGHSSASLVVLGVLLFVFRYTEDRSLGSNLLVLNAACAVLIGSWGVRLSVTRSAYLALLPLIIFGLLWFWRRVPHCRWFCLAAFSATLVFFVPKIVDILDKGTFFQDSSSSGRLMRFAAVWEWICANPFLGLGFRAQALMKALPEPASHWYSHNILLESYVIGGLLMFVVLIIFLSTVIHSIWTELVIQWSDPGPDITGLALAFLWIQALILASFSGHPALLPGFWVGGSLVVLANNPVMMLGHQSTMRRE
ncbi:O-antigen ligase [Synechococcus sp. MIT S9508]|uniref:O-antigen ligase family protein n=1 Tax=Synechococcus sp. MIT S9508 TaxID=1801629 RepID=UPI0009412468|nr:O-antigen ligase family protein [Synechococcus sp. MIT S9508]